MKSIFIICEALFVVALIVCETANSRGNIELASVAMPAAYILGWSGIISFILNKALSKG